MAPRRDLGVNTSMLEDMSSLTADPSAMSACLIMVVGGMLSHLLGI